MYAIIELISTSYMISGCMRILYLAFDVDIDGKTGDSIHVREVMRNFVKFDVDATLIAKSSKNKLLFRKVKIIKVKSIGLLGLGDISRFLINILVGSLELMANDYDVIYDRYSLLNVGGILGKLFNIPVIYELNGIIHDENKILNRNYIGTLKKYLEYWETFAFKLPQKFVVVTQGIKDYLIETYDINEGDIVVVENGFSVDIFENKSDINKNIKLNYGYIYICFVGHLLRWQGIKYLIKAAPDVIKQFPNVRFLIVGDGPVKKELMELTEEFGVSNNFIFTGSVPHEQVPSYINASDLCVAPFIIERNSKSGLSPMKLYEYLACGKAIVASNIPGVNELLRNSGGGSTVTPENPKELANTIAILLRNDDLRKTMGDRGRAYVIENHSWTSVTKKLLALCNKLSKDYSD